MWADILFVAGIVLSAAWLMLTVGYRRGGSVTYMERRSFWRGVLWLSLRAAAWATLQLEARADYPGRVRELQSHWDEAVYERISGRRAER